MTTYPFPIEASIDDLKQALEKGETTSQELVYFYMKQIATYNDTVNAVAEVNPDAEFIAKALDEEYRIKGPRGPLHGIPVLLKDNIDTGDKMHTTAGSLALKDHYADQDACIVKRLREAGAVILGKVNLTEWANFISDHMPSGYSSRSGQVNNPYGPETFDVGGSSAGSAAAVACNMAPIAIGTETSGSILNPACQNNLVGIKPTIGLVSRTGIIPISHSQDTAGPIAKSVRDAAILLNAIVGKDEADPVTALGASNGQTDYTDFLVTNGLKGKRIGVPRPRFYEDCSRDVLERIDEALDAMKVLGADIVDPITIPESKAEESFDVLVYEFKPALNAYLSQVEAHLLVHSLNDIVAFNGNHATEALKYGQALFEAAERTKGTLAEAIYLDSRLEDLKYGKGIDQVMEDHQLDAVVFPSSWGSSIAAKAGYPSICVPIGFTQEGEPVGLSFTARAFEEPKLIAMTYAYEQANPHRRAPVLDVNNR